jgi:hypothetical protein
LKGDILLKNKNISFHIQELISSEIISAALKYKRLSKQNAFLKDWSFFEQFSFLSWRKWDSFGK